MLKDYGKGKKKNGLMATQNIWKMKKVKLRNLNKLLESCIDKRTLKSFMISFLN